MRNGLPQQCLIIERLLDEIGGAGFHGFHCKRHVTVPGDQDHRA
jgi:hypothetical protein